MGSRQQVWVSWSEGALDRQHGESVGLLQMLAVLISGTQMTKATTQLKITNRTNGLRKKAKIYFIVILRVILHKEALEKNDEI